MCVAHRPPVMQMLLVLSLLTPGRGLTNNSSTTGNACGNMTVHVCVNTTGNACGNTTVNVCSNITVKVYNLIHNPNMKQEYARALVAGFNASVNSTMTAERLPGGVKLEVVYVSPGSKGAMTPDVVLEDLKKEKESSHNYSTLPVMLGPVGDVTAEHLLPVLRQRNIVAFAPFTGSSKIRVWHKNLYFITASPTAELLALLRYAVTQLRLERLGFMYLQGVSFGDEEYRLTVNALSNIGRGLCGLFTVKSSLTARADKGEFEAAWKKFAETRPQGVIVFGSPLHDTKEFLKRMQTEEGMKKVHLLLPSVLQLITEDTYKETVGVTTRRGKSPIYVSGTNPLAKDTNYKAIKRFREDMQNYLKKEPAGKHHSIQQHHHDHNDIDGEFMVYGWLAGEVLKEALGNPVWLKDRKTFMDSLYKQRRYMIDDLVIGDFGGECEGMAREHGAACECNQGGTVVYMNRIEDGHRLFPLKDGSLMLASSRCYRDMPQLYAPLSGVYVSLENNAIATRATAAFTDGASALTGRGQLGHGDRFFLHRLTSPAGGAVRALEKEMSERAVTAVFGVVNDAMLSMSNVVFIDPVTLSPRPKVARRNVLYLSPTLEQQLFVIAKNAATQGSDAVSALIRSKDAAGIQEMVRKVAKVFNMPLDTTVTLRDSDRVSGRLPPDGDVLLIGLAASDIEPLASHLDNHPGVRVFVPFFDFALLYDNITSAFKGRPGAERLLFATNLPHWAEGNAMSETVRGFHRAVPDKSKWTPLALLGFATGRAIQSLLSRMGEVTSETLVNSIFTQSVITADDMQYGPFSEKCDTWDAASYLNMEDCVVNYGAVRIALWSVARVFDPSLPCVAEAATPSIIYEERGFLGLTDGQLTGVLNGALFILVLAIAGSALMLSKIFQDARDNRRAPKEPTDPVTLIFTDIESSTALWAAHPTLMPDAVEAHHQLIRSLIVRYGCYEVKTVGDSFMIACRSPLAAVQLAGDLQRCFLHHDWGTTALDDSYHEFELQKAEAGGYEPPTAHLDPCVYRELWNGLRVRIGIHTELCDIRLDEVTKGYDYYGCTSNIAARTEHVANGGQVLLTRAAYYSLSTAEREQVSVTSLGEATLRDVPDPVEIYQLEAVPGREFAALRLEHELDEGEQDISSSATDSIRNE
ncbi:unnamed protein product [Trypanosoma congolense IL3000]|uniref:adenylate cyclase n=1 Tax=Trypanosoma congolense (strain IL3000) TaxID=1068625 RepID=F9WJH6_TRYCI|nr:unnamed protein product [Trypanosoma congolense IL3000]